ncbi:DUF1801 domain-containing protein [Roseobacter sp. HKCCA0434]|uniref:DUF1801 domain-containing protein n=1 Tax=Roseobacter sp. HKCCA0434 TaxID=3079297 RepID=UPI002905EC4A|nr:DUF1801 domain-containing protein [Roseobacter sp. HKCCA0434]
MDVQDTVERLRALIYEVAAANPEIGPLREGVAWGQPSFRQPTKGIGTAVRIGEAKGAVWLLVHCQTSLIAEHRARWGDELTYDGNRGLRVDDVDDPRVAQFVHSVLTYRLK